MNCWKSTLTFTAGTASVLVSGRWSLRQTPKLLQQVHVRTKKNVTNVSGTYEGNMSLHSDTNSLMVGCTVNEVLKDRVRDNEPE